MSTERFDRLPLAEEAMLALDSISDEHSKNPDDHADVTWYASIAIADAALSAARDLRRIRELLEAHLKPTKEK